jgi:hypothetical protein
VLGLGIVVTSLVAATGPFRQSREFRRTVACEQSVADCFGRESGSIVGRRTYTTTTTHTDASGHTYTTTENHWEVTWQRADGTRTARDVSSSFYRKAREGQPAELRTWRGDVVGVEVMGGDHWFLPKAGETLSHWLYLAWFGVGVLLWSLLLGWWDGWFMFAFRTFCWMFMCFVPVNMLTEGLAYGFDTGSALVVDAVVLVLFTGVAAAMVLGSLDRW